MVSESLKIPPLKKKSILRKKMLYWSKNVFTGTVVNQIYLPFINKEYRRYLEGVHKAQFLQQVPNPIRQEMYVDFFKCVFLKFFFKSEMRIKQSIKPNRKKFALNNFHRIFDSSLLSLINSISRLTITTLGFQFLQFTIFMFYIWLQSISKTIYLCLCLYLTAKYI